MDAGRQHPPLTPVTLNWTDRSKVLLAASRGHRPGYYVNNVRTRHGLLGELSTSIEWTDQLLYFIVFTRIGFGSVHFIGKLQIKGRRHTMWFGVPVLEQVEDGQPACTETLEKYMYTKEHRMYGGIYENLFSFFIFLSNHEKKPHENENTLIMSIFLIQVKNSSFLYLL